MKWQLWVLLESSCKSLLETIRFSELGCAPSYEGIIAEGGTFEGGDGMVGSRHCRFCC